MTVMAAEAAAPEAAATATGGSGAATAAGAGVPDTGGGREASKGVLLALAIILLWLAGLAFFIALEGSKLLGEAADPSGGGFLKAIAGGIARGVQAASTGGLP